MLCRCRTLYPGAIPASLKEALDFLLRGIQAALIREPSRPHSAPAPAPALTGRGFNHSPAPCPAPWTPVKPPDDLPSLRDRRLAAGRHQEASRDCTARPWWRGGGEPTPTTPMGTHTADDWPWLLPNPSPSTSLVTTSTPGTTVALVGEKAIAHHALRLMEQQDAQRAK